MPRCEAAALSRTRVCAVYGAADRSASAATARRAGRTASGVVPGSSQTRRPISSRRPGRGTIPAITVAARTLRAAAETVPGVRAGSCRLLDAGADDVGAVGVRLDIHAPVGVPLPPLTARVRERVREAADREPGMVTAAVDIRVTDLFAVAADDGQEGRTP